MANQMMFVGVACFCLVALLFADEASARVMAPRYAPEMAPLGAPEMVPETAPMYAPEMAPIYAPEMAPEMAPAMAPAYLPEVSPVGVPSALIAPELNPAAVSAAAHTHFSSVATLVFTALLALHFL